MANKQAGFAHFIRRPNIPKNGRVNGVAIDHHRVVAKLRSKGKTLIAPHETRQHDIRIAASHEKTEAFQIKDFALKLVFSRQESFTLLVGSGGKLLAHFGELRFAFFSERIAGLCLAPPPVAGEGLKVGV